MFNGRTSARNGALLPAFFQGLLPEGVCETTSQHSVIATRKTISNYSLRGRDLPGNLYASPAHLDATALSGLVSPEVALDEEVVAEPMEDGVSVSGIQPKIGVGSSAR